jgi:hypothetical protein
MSYYHLRKNGDIYSTPNTLRLARPVVNWQSAHQFATIATNFKSTHEASEWREQFSIRMLAETHVASKAT